MMAAITWLLTDRLILLALAAADRRVQAPVDNGAEEVIRCPRRPQEAASMRTAFAILSVLALLGPAACASAPRKGGCVGLNCGLVLDQPLQKPAPLTAQFDAGKVTCEGPDCDVALDQTKDKDSERPEGRNEDETLRGAGKPNP